MKNLKEKHTFDLSNLDYQIQQTEKHIKMATIAQYVLSIVFITVSVVIGGPLITKAMSNAIHMQLEIQSHQLEELRGTNQ